MVATHQDTHELELEYSSFQDSGIKLLNHTSSKPSATIRKGLYYYKTNPNTRSYHINFFSLVAWILLALDGHP